MCPFICFCHQFQHALTSAPLLIGTAHDFRCLVAKSIISIKAASIVLGGYTHLQDLTKLEDCTEQDRLFWWSVCLLPMDLDNWTELLFAHPDHDFASYMLVLNYC